MTAEPTKITVGDKIMAYHHALSELNFEAETLSLHPADFKKLCKEVAQEGEDTSKIAGFFYKGMRIVEMVAM